MAMCDNLSRRLREIKEERGLSVTEFAEELGISRSALQAILTCKGNPRTDTIEHIANKLHLDPVSLLIAPSDFQQESRLIQQIVDYMLIKLKEKTGEDDE